MIGATTSLSACQWMARSGRFYVRFMDEILALSPTRRTIRKVVKVIDGMLGSPG